jgi:hypothetical protein
MLLRSRPISRLSQTNALVPSTLRSTLKPLDFISRSWLSLVTFCVGVLVVWLGIVCLNVYVLAPAVAYLDITKPETAAQIGEAAGLANSLLTCFTVIFLLLSITQQDKARREESDENHWFRLLELLHAVEDESHVEDWKSNATIELTLLDGVFSDKDLPSKTIATAMTDLAVVLTHRDVGILVPRLWRFEHTLLALAHLYKRVPPEQQKMLTESVHAYLSDAAVVVGIFSAIRSQNREILVFMNDIGAVRQIFPEGHVLRTFIELNIMRNDSKHVLLPDPM